MADKNLRLQIILEGLDRITAPLKSITGASSNARRDLAKTHGELKSLDALQKQVGSYKAKQSGLATNTKAYHEQQGKLAAMQMQLEATAKPTKKLRDEFARAERQVAQLGNQLDKGRADLQQLSGKLSEAGIDVKALAVDEERLARKVGAANFALEQQTAQLDKVNRAQANSQKLSDISGKATGAGLGMIAAGTATALPITMAVKQAMTLESGMADVNKVANMTSSQIEQLSNDFLDMSEKIPMAANEFPAIAAAAASAGVGMDKFGKPMRDQREQLLQFTNDAAEMAVAFDLTADVAGDTMGKWRSAFELPQAGVVALGDGVNALANRFGGKAANISDIITRIGPLGKVAGLAAPEIAALGSSLDSIGIPSEVAATGIKNTMLALTKGEAATKGQQEAFGALGLSATEMGKRMQKDASGAIIDVMERIKNLAPEKQAGILTELFGSESVAAIAPLLTNLDGLKQRLALVGDQSAIAGSMHQEFLTRVGNTEGATTIAGNALTNLNTTMGDALLPTVKEAAEKVTELASAFRGWAQENPALAKGLMIFLAVGAGLLIMVGGLALAFGALTAAAAPIGIALLPLLGIVAAVAALAAAAYLIYANWDQVAAFFTALWNRLKEAFDGGILGVLSLLWELGGLLIGALWTAIKAAIGALPAIGSALFSALKMIIWDGFLLLPRLFFQFGINSIKGLIDGLVSMFPRLGGIIKKIGNMLPDGIRKLLDINSPSRVFAKIGGHVMEGLDQGLATNTSGPLQRITDLSGQMTRALAVGAGGVAMAAASPAAATAGSAGGARALTVPSIYNITINANGSGQSQDIEEAVRRAIEQIKREEQARTFADREY